MSNQQILDLCKQGISDWQAAFNSGNAAGCAACYVEDALMEAKPMGEFQGRAAIQAFWQKIMDDGFTNVEYTDVEWQPVGDDGFLLSSKWTMNKAFGVVHKEHWVVEADGKARLKTDEFEMLGER